MANQTQEVDRHLPGGVVGCLQVVDLACRECQGWIGAESDCLVPRVAESAHGGTVGIESLKQVHGLEEAERVGIVQELLAQRAVFAHVVRHNSGLSPDLGGQVLRISDLCLVLATRRLKLFKDAYWARKRSMTPAAS